MNATDRKRKQTFATIAAAAGTSLLGIAAGEVTTNPRANLMKFCLIFSGILLLAIAIACRVAASESPKHDDETDEENP